VASLIPETAIHSSDWQSETKGRNGQKSGQIARFLVWVAAKPVDFRTPTR
jgi:hypothetical protein